MSKIFTLLLISSILLFSASIYADEIQFNNGSENEYSNAASLSGTTREIQARTTALWPRAKQGLPYFVASNNIIITENDKFLILQTNNLPNHQLTTTNPNCAREQSFKFLIPKAPQKLSSPKKITKNMQEIGVAVNGVVIAGPYDSENKIAPYNRTVDLCSSHADPHGLYHYHFAPLCLKDNNGRQISIDEKKHIGWSFDGYKIRGLANRLTHLPEIDVCNGHQHDGEYHYHVTRDFPFFMGCYKAAPQTSNFAQKSRGAPASSASCPSKGRGQKFGKASLGQGANKKRPNFRKAASVLDVSENVIKKALGPPPGNFPRAAKQLGISERKLKDALGLKK